MSFLTYLWHYLLARLIYDHLLIVGVVIVATALAALARRRSR